MLPPGAAGEWSVKDVIAHVMWGEREMVGVMQTHTLVGSDLWNLPEDERNAIMVAEQRDRSLHDVLTEERQVYAQFVEQVQALPDEDFTDARRFREMPEQWLPWQVLGWADGLSRAAELAPDRRNGGYSRRYLSASLETYLRI